MEPQVILASNEHVNRHPVEIKLFPVDVPSDGAPYGASGRKLIVPSDVAHRDLPSLVGMGIGSRADLTGHDNRNKIGVVTDAFIKDGWAIAKGYLFAYDFPEAVTNIRAAAASGDLGASFESTQTYMYNPPLDGVWVVKQLLFTGLALMQRMSAAWTKTSVLASQEKTVDPENNNNPSAPTISDPTPPNLAETVLRHGTAIESIQGAVADVGTALNSFTGTLTSIQAALDDHSSKLQDVATQLNDMKCATEGKDVSAATDKEIADLKAELAALKEANTKNSTDLAAANEKIATNLKAPTRKTFGPATVLAKFGIQAGDESSDYESSIRQIDDLRSKGVLNVEQSLAAKMLLRDEKMTSPQEKI